MLFNAASITLLIAYMSAKFGAIDERLQNVNERFQRMDQRFDDMRDLWRSELHRVEEVLDARLKHLKAR